MRMKKKVFLAALVAAVGVVAAPRPLDLNGTWEFRFEEGKSWQQVDAAAFTATDPIIVPGCFDAMPKWFMKRGTGLYRRTFTLDAAVDNAWLVIDGLGLYGTFKIDGRDIGVDALPWSRVELETGPLAAGVHTLVAAVDNRFDWSYQKLVRTYYDFHCWGGFFHGVSLSFDNRKLFVRTRDYKTGTVEIEAVNFSAPDFAATLVFDSRNEVKASFKGGRATVKVPDFKLWSTDHPNLHTVAIREPSHLPHASQPSARFGIRTVEAKNGGIYLNGERIFLKGANRHDQQLQSGAATPESFMLTDIQNLKAMGGNFFRGAHYPQSQRFLDLCDEHGVLVWEESLGWGNGQRYTNNTFPPNELKDPEFCEMQVKQTRDMVRAGFNHPCVIISGFLNECNSETPECKALVDRLIETIKAERTGRLVTFACNMCAKDICNANTDIVAFNTYPGTIPMKPGTAAQLAEQVRKDFTQKIADFRKRYPEKPIMVSESGCGCVYGAHDPQASICTEEFQDEYLTDIMSTLWSNPDCVGYAIWQMNDGRTRERFSSTKTGSVFFGGSIAGVFDAQRRPKMSARTIKRFFEQK